jgi:hypothetical protein
MKLKIKINSTKSPKIIKKIRTNKKIIYEKLKLKDEIENK